jgi:hypothetical protein
VSAETIEVALLLLIGARCSEQFAAFKAGNLYINVHSPEHKPGEIRGQIKP